MSDDQRPSSTKTPYWLGTAKRKGILLKFVVVCVVIALLILGMIIYAHP
jgi:hypothetical protein